MRLFNVLYELELMTPESFADFKAMLTDAGDRALVQEEWDTLQAHKKRMAAVREGRVEDAEGEV